MYIEAHLTNRAPREWHCVMGTAWLESGHHHAQTEGPTGSILLHAFSEDQNISTSQDYVMI